MTKGPQKISSPNQKEKNKNKKVFVQCDFLITTDKLGHNLTQVVSTNVIDYPLTKELS